jgi:molybdate transport system substrate-binding protein
MKALEILQRGDFRTLAIANPDLAPYGLAAEQTLQALEQWDRLKSRLVFGQNIGQAHAMVATGNADYGFVALSSVQSERNRLSHEYWEVPQDMYSPIRQEAVLLRHGSDNKAAVAFHEFLQSTAAKEMILAAGFGVE